MPAKEKAIEDKKNILEMCLLNISFKQMVYLKKKKTLTIHIGTTSRLE